MPLNKETKQYSIRIMPQWLVKKRVDAEILGQTTQPLLSKSAQQKTQNASILSETNISSY